MHARLELGLSALKALQNDWQKLEASVNACVFIRFDWCLYQASLTADPVIVTVWEDKRCVGILPLAERQLSAKANINVLTHLCQRFTDYQSVLLADDVSGDRVFSIMLKALGDSTFSAHSLYFPYPDNYLSERLKHYADCRPCQSWTHTQFRSLGAPIKAKVAREARRRFRKLQETGDVNVVVNAEYDEQLVNWILDMSATRHGENSLTAAAHRNAILKLLSTFRKDIHLSYVSKDGAFIAGHLGFIDNATLQYFVPVTDETERRFSPGIILLHEIIQTLGDHHIDTIDYLRGEESYKNDWGNAHETRNGLLLPAPFGLNLKRRALTALWLKRNP